MKIIQLAGSYHKKQMDVYLYSPLENTNIVTIICNGLFSVFDSRRACGANLLGGMLVDKNISHIVFYNSSRDFSFTADSDFKDREAAFANKTFANELTDLRTVIQYIVDHAESDFGINQSELILYLHGTSIGGTVALMVTVEFTQILKLSLCAPPLSRGTSKKPIISTIPEPEKILSVARQFTGDMFLLYGGNDSVVPKESSFSIVTHAVKSNTSSLVVPNANHNFRKLDNKETPDAHKVFATAIFDFFTNNATT